MTEEDRIKTVVKGLQAQIEKYPITLHPTIDKSACKGLGDSLYGYIVSMERNGLHRLISVLDYTDRFWGEYPSLGEFLRYKGNKKLMTESPYIKERIKVKGRNNDNIITDIPRAFDIVARGYLRERFRGQLNGNVWLQDSLFIYRAF
jgi:hypothetical protein